MKSNLTYRDNQYRILSRAEQSRAEQSRAEQSRAEQSNNIFESDIDISRFSDFLMQSFTICRGLYFYMLKTV